MKKFFTTGSVVLLTTGILIALNSKPKSNVSDLTLQNIETLAFIVDEGHDVTIPCKEQKKNLALKDFMTQLATLSRPKHLKIEDCRTTIDRATDTVL